MNRLPVEAPPPAGGRGGSGAAGGTAGARLRERKTSLWSRSFLHYHFLWRNIEAAVRSALAELRALDVPDPRVLDVGCGERPYRDLFVQCWYVGLNNSAENASPHVVGDALRLPFADGSIDLVFCSQVIEHVPDPQLLLAECARVLAPHGRLVLSAPMYWPLHEEPHDYFRFTRYGLQMLLGRAGFSADHVVADGGTWAQIGQSLALAVPRWLRPVVPLTNACFLALELLRGDARSSINYSVKARLSPPKPGPIAGQATSYLPTT